MMLVQEIVFTGDFLKASRIRDYGQLKKISCGNNKQARAREIHEFSGSRLLPKINTLRGVRRYTALHFRL
ncbi:hypothetical protein [Thiolapillus sp.]|uniref:hypothetical protein n=1 Tax=Thiolapillus sp. TaxID=2017437 RepID=UPI0025E1D4C0|nr:hypothetical protein [Thiolapillus sp.]